MRERECGYKIIIGENDTYDSLYESIKDIDKKQPILIINEKN